LIRISARFGRISAKTSTAQTGDKSAGLLPVSVFEKRGVAIQDHQVAASSRREHATAVALPDASTSPIQKFLSGILFEE